MHLPTSVAEQAIDWSAYIPDPQLARLFLGVLGILVLATVLGAILKRRARSDSARRTVENLNARTSAWWTMSAIFALTLLVGRIGSLILFALMSLLALREYITRTVYGKEARHHIGEPDFLKPSRSMVHIGG